MIILGINGYHPDASVALLKDGELVWAGEEERFNRIKHSSGFPVLALQRCLKDTGTSPSEIDAVAIGKNPRANLARKLLFSIQSRPDIALLWDRAKAFRKASQFKNDFLEAVKESGENVRAKFIHVEHHLAHAASSFFISGFDRAAVLTLDGLGDFSSAMRGFGEGNKLKVLDRIYFPHSAGFLYTAATQFLGFLHFGDEYKVMGLAGFGKPVFIREFRKLVRLTAQGRFELNLDYFLHSKGQAKVRWEGGAPEQDILFSPAWQDLLGAPRLPGAEITPRHQDIAASLQLLLEEIYFHVLNHLYQLTREERLCLAGGVAFNSVANGKITQHTPFKHIYIQPAAGDAGTALGAALFVSHALHGQPRRFVMDHALWGSFFTESEIVKAIKDRRLPYEKFTENEILQRTAKGLAEGKIVGWFQGRMEFGPRALGNRSILADPRRADMKDVLNKRIKHREAFRPFAPAVIEEKAGEFFEMDCASSPFMLKVFRVREEKKSALPAITHVDGTARVQTVARESQPLFWNLLKAFEKESGVPVLLNTSFNENEPIVCLPEEALECFLKTQMDVLVMGNYFLKRN